MNMNHNRINALVSDFTRPARRMPARVNSRVKARVEQMQANRKAVNADLKKGIPTVTGMVARSEIAQHRENTFNRNRSWTTGAFNMLAAKYGADEAVAMLSSTGHNKRHIEHAAQLYAARIMDTALDEFDNDPHPWMGDISTLF